MERQAALYARVSSEQQATAHTIASQLAALRERVAADGLTLRDDLSFIDEGYSGATLIRPALEGLRDAAAAGEVDRLYVHSPDRLARKYAYQALLLDEFQRAGVEVVFLNRALGQSPEDDLLLQVQGMVAEYERAKILERSRRGKRHGAHSGVVNVLSGAPYGYRYLTKHEGSGQARYEILLEEARVEGLICCALCGYAYYGKAISPSAAKYHDRHYAYYRCVGSDGYRFGGQRLCHNTQLRTDLVDLAVWSQVRALLEQPERLRQEYQRRLDDPGQQERRADLTTTQAQIRKLEQAIGRLIDSYAEGLLEKDEFAPRLARLKERVAVLETQATDLAAQAALESDLRLIIGQLDDFAATVRERLDQLDWETQRGIIRTLVKRVEIDQEQIHVVFRIGPGPLVSDPEPTIMHHCGRRDQPPVV
jgi:DNA invertase Pin-like site-specific DNA recombinase